MSPNESAFSTQEMTTVLQSLLSTRLVRAASVADTAYDAVIVIGSCVKAAANHAAIQSIAGPLAEFNNLHSSLTSSAALLAVDRQVIPSGRLIFSGTGPVHRDFDDVRSYLDAGKKAVQLALSAGVRSPLLVTVPHPRHPQAELIAALGALHPQYTPLNIREEDEKRRTKFDQMGLLPLGADSELVGLIEGFEQAFVVSRDIGDQGPERMAPPRVAQYVQTVFANSSSVSVSVEADPEHILKEYPLMAAVNRCANSQERHRARLIRLEYTGEGQIEESLVFVGKGVTIDTGGCDLKTDGHMFGMCRDKYGSAVVAGFFKALDVLKPKGIKVIGYMCMVRNSIGSNAFTCDEVITARSGKRVHIYNTDAEGRITMLDPLTRAKDEALSLPNPHVFTLATLTGHEILSYGYSAAIMDNGPAKAAKTSSRIQMAGDEYGQPVEISRLMPSDFAFHQAECEQADVRQGNTKPSVQTLRGHQTPAAFLMMASRIDEHGLDSDKPLKYSHIDMGGACGDHPHASFPNPLVALTAAFVLPRL